MRRPRIDVTTATLGVLAFAGAAAPLAANAAEPAALVADWQSAIVHVERPAGGGCFTAAYPELAWHQVACKAIALRPFVPAHGGRHRFTVGNGNDYAAVTSTLTSQGVGTFPTVTGVTKETGFGEANVYSLQLNSEFFNSAACAGSNTGECQGWQQFVYSSSEEAAFMQYWLINYGNTCPDNTWNQYEGSCYKNSTAVGVPQEPISLLSTMQLLGKAVKGGSDTLTYTVNGRAYTTSGSDTVTYLASSWDQSEFNIVGDGGGSAAKFNKGSSVTVKVSLTDGSTSAPTCESDDGTTGETNNLTLHSCSTAGGSTPSISFVESN